ncbi:MAG: cell envelope biogenesis protein LolA [Kordia sp.]|nr:MAG: cell envelope biogenesis protein LolA [Kordia sp.]
MRNILYLLFLLTATVHSQEKMTTAEATLLKEKVKTQAAETKTITSDFVQYKHLDFLTNDIVTKGYLAFKIPDLVKWSYVDPFVYSVIFKDENLYINDEGQKSDVNLSSSKLFKQLNKLIVNSVKGDMFDDNEFEISYFINKKYSEVHFSPTNKKIAKYIKAFHIQFNSNGDVVEIKMIEPSDDYTRIVFSNRVLNKTMSDAVFAH